MLYRCICSLIVEVILRNERSNDEIQRGKYILSFRNRITVLGRSHRSLDTILTELSQMMLYPITENTYEKGAFSSVVITCYLLFNDIICNEIKKYINVFLKNPPTCCCFYPI